MTLWDKKLFGLNYEEPFHSTHVLEFLNSVAYSTILDVGCARGGLLKELLGKGDLDYYGVDISKNMIKLNKTQFPKHSWKVGGIDNLPVEDNSFDMVVCANVLTHVERDNINKAVSECFRVSKQHVLLRIRESLFFHTLYGYQDYLKCFVPYNIFGRDFIKLIKKHGEVKKIDRWKGVLNISGKATIHIDTKINLFGYIPVYSTAILIEKRK